MSWRLNPEDCALLIVDVQEKLFPLIDRKEELLQKLKLLVAGCRELGLPVVVTEQCPEKLGPTVPELSSVLKGVKPVSKTSFSAAEAFAGAETGRRVVLVAGIETHICVRQTAFDLRAAGKNAVIVADATASRDAGNKALAVEEFQSDRLMITSVEAVLYEFMQGSTHPAFKAVTKLVKAG